MSRRRLVIGGTIALGALVVANTEIFQDTLREVTLPLRHEDIIRQQAAEKGVPADLIAAVIYTESRFREHQTSSAGAQGLMQLTPVAVTEIQKRRPAPAFKLDDLDDPDINIRYGTAYLQILLEKYSDNEVATLAAYNAGETNVAAWGGSELSLDDIEFDDARDYVDSVLEKQEDYADHYGEELGLD